MHRSLAITTLLFLAVVSARSIAPHDALPTCDSKQFGRFRCDASQRRILCDEDTEEWLPYPCEANEHCVPDKTIGATCKPSIATASIHAPSQPAQCDTPFALDCVGALRMICDESSLTWKSYPCPASSQCVRDPFTENITCRGSSSTLSTPSPALVPVGESCSELNQPRCFHGQRFWCDDMSQQWETWPCPAHTQCTTTPTSKAECTPIPHHLHKRHAQPVTQLPFTEGGQGDDFWGVKPLMGKYMLGLVKRSGESSQE